MVGGERPGGNKPAEPRFNDKKRRKLTPHEQAAASQARAQVPLNFVSSKDLKFCPYHGRLLEGSAQRCPECRKGFLERRVFRVPPEQFSCVVDSRPYGVFWRRKLFTRVVPPFHSNVRFSVQPHIAFPVFHSLFREDLTYKSFVTSAAETNIKQLQTTWAVESSLSFGLIDGDYGYGACKIGKAGSVLMVVPPVEVAHVESKKTGARVQITFGWIQLTTRGTIQRAEHMPVPDEGWPHVFARIRDAAVHMQAAGLEVDSSMVKVSEEKLRATYNSLASFTAAREARESNRTRVLPPRPRPPPLPPRTVSKSRLAEKAKKSALAAQELYKPFEAKKRYTRQRPPDGEIARQCMHACVVWCTLSSSGMFALSSIFLKYSCFGKVDYKSLCKNDICSFTSVTFSMEHSFMTVL